MFYFMAKIIIWQTCNKKIWAKINSLNTLLISVWIIIYYKNDAKNVLDYLVETLVEAGVKHIYAITGDSLI
jgi:5,10-methylenetetrahydrofolate reductase